MSARPSLRSRVLRRLVSAMKNTESIDGTVEAAARAEVDGRPAPQPPRSAMRGVVAEVRDLAGTNVHVLRPRAREPRLAVLLLHGGGYIEESHAGVWQLATRFVRRLDAEVWIPAYRLAPRQTAAVTVPRMRDVYTAVLAQWSTDRIAVIGDSAGGGLALAVVQDAHVAGVNAPALLGLFAPWVDLRMQRPEERDTRDDPMLDYGRLSAAARAYAGELPLRDPRVSPILGDLRQLPRTWVITGTDDVLVHQSRALVAAMAEAGAPVTYLEDAHMMHVHVMLPIPEARAALARFESELAGLG